MKLRNDMKILWVLSRDRYIVIRPSSISEKGVAICARVGSTVDLIKKSKLCEWIQRSGIEPRFERLELSSEISPGEIWGKGSRLRTFEKTVTERMSSGNNAFAHRPAAYEYLDQL